MIMRPITTSTSSSRLALLVPVAAAAITACAGPKPPVERVAWPLPPDKPRIQYVRSITNSGDLESGLRRFWRSVTGAKATALFNPTIIAIGPDDRLYVSLTTSGTVLVFDLAKGVAARTAGEEGRRPSRPYGLALDGEGNLYVGDQGEKLVWKYDKDGKFVRQIGKGMFDRPVGVAFDRQRRLLYVVDGSNGSTDRHRVEVFDVDGRHQRTIGRRGTAPGEFNFPTAIAIAPDGRVFVADTGNFRIEIFAPDGEFITMFGSIGEGPGLLGRAKGLAFDNFGNLYVVDGQLQGVQLFSPKFRPLMAFGGAVNRPEYMTIPNGIAIDSRNHIFVADFAFNHVNEYELVNTTAADSEEN
jgi:sugar lactone lactonase YvrE